jgi:hypothetical protein
MALQSKGRQKGTASPLKLKSLLIVKGTKVILGKRIFVTN